MPIVPAACVKTKSRSKKWFFEEQREDDWRLVTSRVPGVYIPPKPAEMILQRLRGQIPGKKKLKLEMYIYNMFIILVGGYRGLARVASLFHIEKRDANIHLAKTGKKRYVKNFIQRSVGKREYCLFDKTEKEKLSDEEQWKLTVSPILEALKGISVKFFIN